MTSDEMYAIISRMHYEDTIDELVEAIIKIFTNERSDLDALHPSDAVQKAWFTIREAADFEGVRL